MISFENENIQACFSERDKVSHFNFDKKDVTYHSPMDMPAREHCYTPRVTISSSPSLEITKANVVDDDDDDAPIALLKIVMSGSSGVGKTTLIRTVTGSPYVPEEKSTIAVDFKVFNLTTDQGQTVKCQVWDTAGQERFHAVSKKYYRGAHVIFFVYAVDCVQSFQEVVRYLDQAEWQQQNDAGVCGYLIANKTDVQTEKRKVSSETGQAFADSRGLVYGEASAKTGDNVMALFKEAATLMMEYNMELMARTHGEESIFVYRKGVEIEASFDDSISTTSSSSCKTC